MRQQVLVIWVLASSAFTCAVIAMRPILPRRVNHPRTRIRVIDAARTPSPACRVVPRRAVADGDVGEHEPRAERRHGLLERVDVVGRASRSASTRVDLQVRGVLGEHREVVLGAEPVGLPCLRLEVEHDDAPGRRSRPAPRAASGTSRCGITEVNHDPGPSTTQSASRDRRRRASGQAGGSAGSRLTATTRPSVVATSTWPRTVRPRVGVAPGRGPRTSAVMSSGVSAIGSTRPVGAEQPADPVEAVDVVAEQLPERRRSAGCRPRGRRISPSLANRCWSTRAQVWPQSSSPHSAASAIRRSPGGSTPNSPRSRPDEPPLSATVTTAVRSSTTRRSADSEAASPWPPPRATTRSSRTSAALTPAPGRGGWPGRRSPSPSSRRGDLLGHRDAAVLAAGAADGDGHEPLALRR